MPPHRFRSFMDWTREFPGLAPGAYLDSCANGLLSRRTRAAIDAYLARWSQDPDWNAWMEHVEAARRSFARFIGAHDDEVSVQSTASSGIAAVLHALPPPQTRRRLVTTDLDFPTAPFLARQQTARGFDHVHLTGAPEPLRVDEWKRHVDEQTALAMIPAIASFNGYRFDVGAFADAAHAAGAPLLVDAFQGIGTYPLDVHRLDVDFLVTGVYKWLMAPPGLAFLYVRRDHHALVPMTSGWQGAAAPYGFDPMDDFAPDARRFQQGGPSVVGCAALSASLSILSDVGLSNIEKHNGMLVQRVMSHAQERGLEVLTPESPEERASIVTFRVPDVEAALAACAKARVRVNSRLGGIRASPHFYNSPEDVDRLFETIDGA